MRSMRELMKVSGVCAEAGKGVGSWILFGDGIDRYVGDLFGSCYGEEV